MLRFFLPLALLWAASAQAQTVRIHVGDGAINGAHILPYDNLWLVQVHYPDGHTEDRGLSSDHLRAREINGRHVLIRIEGTTNVPGPSHPLHGAFNSTFNVFDSISMAPLQGEAFDSTGAMEAHVFDNLDVATTTRDERGASATTHLALSEPVYDFNGGMTGLILAALPLRAGYRAQIPTLGDNGFDLVDVAVEQNESVAAGHLGRVRAWRVRVGPPEDGTLYWVRPSPPYVIRAAITRSDGVVATWTME